MKNELKSKKKYKLTIGITTCYGKRQLLHVIDSIHNSRQLPKYELIVVADNIPISSDIKKKLQRSKIMLIENDKPRSAYYKQKQILKVCNSDVIILTQDDVIFERDALSNIYQTFDDPGITFVGLRNEPFKPTTAFERGVNVGTRLSNTIGRLWRGGDNYLAVLGRVMAFRTDWISNELKVHTDSVSLDAYLYFENKSKGGKYKCIWDSCLYFRNPDNMEEHIRKSSRFQNSKDEMESYNKFSNLENEYNVPKYVMIHASLVELFHDPIGFLIYLYIFLHTRIFKISAVKSLTALWEVDLSTKRIENKLIQSR